MTDLPAAAIAAARKGVRAYYAGNISMLPAERDIEHLEAMADAALEAAAPHLTPADPTTENEGFRAYKAGAAAEREKIRAAIADEYGPSEARKMRRVLLGDST